MLYFHASKLNLTNLINTFFYLFKWNVRKSNPVRRTIRSDSKNADSRDGNTRLLSTTWGPEVAAVTSGDTKQSTVRQCHGFTLTRRRENSIFFQEFEQMLDTKLETKIY